MAKPLRHGVLGLLGATFLLLLCNTELLCNLAGATQAGRSQLAHEVDYTNGIDMPRKFTPYELEIPEGFPSPELPNDNPLIEERVRLGEMLFFDPALSINNQVSCATCHEEKHAFSDPNRLSQGVGFRPTRRHSMQLFNLAWKSEFFWDGRSPSLRDQVLHPIRNPNEMGERIFELLGELREIPEYRKAFGIAYGSGAITPRNLSMALESYLIRLVSVESKYDQAVRGDATLSKQEQRGMELFMTKPQNSGAGCFQCHSDPLFTDDDFHNNGLRSRRDWGLGEVTRNSADKGRFSTPTLRNIALSAPYMHNGQFSTLHEVIMHYNRPMRRANNLDPVLAVHAREGLNLSNDDVDALVAFLRTLTDVRYESTELAAAGAN